VSCPGDLLSGLVDGELDHPTRERVLSHLMACPGCQQETETLRTLKARLQWAGAETPLPSEAFSARLRGLAVPGVDPVGRSRPGPVRAAPGRSTPGRSTPGRSTPGRSQPSGPPGVRRLSRRRAVGSLVALGLSAAFVLGGQGAASGTRVPIDPTTDQFVTDYVNATVEVPLAQPVDATTASLAGTTR
jgi:anti-sigma factor RsiW